MEKTEVYEILKDAYLRYGETLVSEMYLYTRDYALAEDCVQDALCVLQSKLSEDVESDFDTPGFLFSVAKKAALKYVDRYSAEVFMADIPQADEIVDDTLAAEIRFMEDEEVLIKVLHSLTPKNRRIFIMHHLSGMSYADIGRALGMTGEAVRKIISRSQKSLKMEILRG